MPLAPRLPAPASGAIIPVSPSPLRDRTPPGARPVRPVRKHWEPPEGLGPDECRAVIAAASCERDRLLLRCLWATGGRISEVLALRPCDVHRDSLVMPNRKNPGRPTKRVFLGAADTDLPGELLVYAREHGLADAGPLFASRQHAAATLPKPLDRRRAWEIVKEASRRAGVCVLALRPSRDGDAGQPAPIHPHAFRHSRVRQIMRSTRSLPLAMKQAGWSRLQMAYLTIGDEEAREMMRGVRD